MPNNFKNACVVEFLDGSEIIVDTNYMHKADELQKYVCQKIGVLKTDYFGLRYTHGCDQKTSWLELDKTLTPQLKKLLDCRLQLAVQFFPDTIHVLQDEVTRYQFVLQTRENLLTGRWTCSMPSQALLASYIVQAEFGKYDAANGDKYLDGLQFSCLQNKDFMGKVYLFHQSHRDMSPAAADWKYLQTASKIMMYGMDIHNVKDGDGNNLILGIDFQGVHVIFHETRLHSFLWPIVSKVAHHEKEVLITITMLSDDQSSQSATVIFMVDTERDAKRVAESAEQTKDFHEQESEEDDAWPPLAYKSMDDGSCIHLSEPPPTPTPTTPPPANFKRVSSRQYSQMFEKFPDWMTTSPNKQSKILSVLDSIDSYGEQNEVQNNRPDKGEADVPKSEEVRFRRDMKEEQIIPEHVETVESEKNEENDLNAPVKGREKTGTKTEVPKHDRDKPSGTIDKGSKGLEKHREDSVKVVVTEVGVSGKRLGVGEVVMLVKEGVLKDDTKKKKEEKEKESEGKEKDKKDNNDEGKDSDKKEGKENDEKDNKKDGKDDNKTLKEKDQSINVDAYLKDYCDVESDDEKKASEEKEESIDVDAYLETYYDVISDDDLD